MCNLGNEKKMWIHTSKVVCKVRVGWGGGGGGGGGGAGAKGLGMCELKKAPQIMQKRPKTYVHDSGP